MYVNVYVCVFPCKSLQPVVLILLLLDSDYVCMVVIALCIRCHLQQ